MLIPPNWVNTNYRPDNTKIMRLKAEYLQQDIAKKMRLAYLVTGDEPLQQMECCDLIRQSARDLGYEEREVFVVERSFDWASFLQSANSLSLFASKKIIELRFNTAKPGDAGSKALIEYFDHATSDNVLIVTMPKIDANTQRAKWFKQVESNGAIIQVWPIEIRNLPAWIGVRMKIKGLKPTSEACKQLAEKVEGNLLSAAQEIEKMAINAPTTVSIEDVLDSAVDDTKYDVFKLVDSTINGEISRIVSIVQSMRKSGEDVLYLLWALTRELRAMVQMAEDKQQGMPLNQILKKHFVWDKRSSIVSQGLQRYSAPQWTRCLQRAMVVDQIIKGKESGDPWDAVLDLCLLMAGKKLMKVAI